MRRVAVMLWAACYAAKAPDGAPCSPMGDCPSGQACVAGTCTAHDAGIDATPAVFALGGQPWLMPCAGAPSGGLCDCPGTVVNTIGLAGDATVYQVTLRIRGVFEGAPYSGGIAGSGDLYTGGDVGDSFHNIYELDVSDPPQHYFVNHGAGAVSAVDYEATLPIAANATVTFVANGQDGKEEINAGPDGMPITIPGVSTTPDPYVGQFVQLDVLSAM